MDERLAARQAVITTLRKLPSTAPTTPARTTAAATSLTSGSRRALYPPVMSRQEFWTMLAAPYELIETNAFSSYVMFTRSSDVDPPGPSTNAPPWMVSPPRRRSSSLSVLS